MSARRKHTLLLTAFVAFGFSISTAVVWASYQGELKQVPVVRWNPRTGKSTAPFLGEHACVQCHKKQSTPYAHSAMRMAMESVADSRVLSANPAFKFRNGPYSYSINRQAKQSTYTVTDGKESLTIPILFAFGQGKSGQTYVFEYQGRLYESMLSFYRLSQVWILP